jgi:hypothetical protein
VNSIGLRSGDFRGMNLLFSEIADPKGKVILTSVMGAHLPGVSKAISMGTPACSAKLISAWQVITKRATKI